MSENRNCFHAGAAARLHILPDQGEYRFVLILAKPPVDAVPASLGRRGELTAILPHDRGATWPHRDGQAIARGVLAQGGAIALGFVTLADALACKTRIDHDNRASAPGGAA
ncbi:hypothetical protein [Belnapia rosea]|uniref:Uncharacterized protein n=1 Tax=Belnapia rosea TaxID=938405 RepID=A0A1G7D726_9PROT|nr:hypothetical protein [Belnapia rosea]SDE47438.1 hypothetical protein SAMN04487779_10412 [Belnapia rosea]